MVTLDIIDRRIIVKFGFDRNFSERLRVVKEVIHGGRFCETPTLGKYWRFPIYKLDKILKAFPDAWQEKGVAEYREFCQQSELRRTSNHVAQPIGIDLPLWDHQRRALGFVGALDKAILNAAVGTGKTPVDIAWGLARMERNGRRGVLVVTKSVGKYKFRWEILRAVKGAKVAVVEGESGYFPGPDDSDWVVLNWDILHPRFDQIKARNFAAVIYSESHKAKAATKSQRGSAALELAREIPCVLMETASLIPNRNAEAFAPCHMLGLVDDDDYYPWHIHFCGSVRKLPDGTIVNLPAGKKVVNRWKNKTVWDFTGSSYSDELHAMLRPYTIQIPKEVLNLIPPTFSPMLVDLSNEAEYNDASTNFLGWVAEKKGPEAVVKAKRAQVLVRLGTLYRLSTIGMASAAIDLLETYTESQEKVVVFCSYKQPLAAIKKHFGEQCVTITGDEDAKAKDAAIEQFQIDPNISVAACATSAAGESCTLTASATVIFLGLPWSPEEFAQCYGRCHRAGQSKHVEVLILLGRKTLDVTKAELLFDKSLNIAAVVTGQDRSFDSEVLAGILADIHGEKVLDNFSFSANL